MAAILQKKKENAFVWPQHTVFGATVRQLSHQNDIKTSSWQLFVRDLGDHLLLVNEICDIRYGLNPTLLSTHVEWIISSGPFYWHGWTLTPAWIKYYIHYQMLDEITYPFPNFNGATIEVWEWSLGMDK